MIMGGISLIMVLALVFGSIGLIFAAFTGKDKLSWFIGASLVGSLLMFLFIWAGRIWILSTIYDMSVNFLSSQLGLDMVFAKFFAAFIAVLSLFAIWPLVNFIIFQQQPGMALGIVVSAFVLIGLGIYIGHDRTFFGREGEHLRYYIVTTAGYEFSSTPGHSQKWGVEYNEVTPEVAANYRYWKQNKRHISEPQVQEPRQFFDRLSGAPIIWYSERKGKFCFYSMPGYDSYSGELLKPVTSAVVTQYEQAKERELKKAQSEARAQYEHYLEAAAKKAAEEIKVATITAELQRKAEERERQKAATNNETRSLELVVHNQNCWTSVFFAEGQVVATVPAGASKLLTLTTSQNYSLKACHEDLSGCSSGTDYMWTEKQATLNVTRHPDCSDRTGNKKIEHQNQVETRLPVRNRGNVKLMVNNQNCVASIFYLGDQYIASVSANSSRFLTLDAGQGYTVKPYDEELSQFGGGTNYIWTEGNSTLDVHRQEYCSSSSQDLQQDIGNRVSAMPVNNLQFFMTGNRRAYNDERIRQVSRVWPSRRGSPERNSSISFAGGRFERRRR